MEVVCEKLVVERRNEGGFWGFIYLGGGRRALARACSDLAPHVIFEKNRPPAHALAGLRAAVTSSTNSTS